VVEGDDYRVWPGPPLVLVIDHEKRKFRMERGLYIAASGMLAQQVRQDQIANDLARL
jgi:hypothetical protein